jgi:two-component sensor histidine kinase
MLRIRSITGHLLLYALALALPILLMSGLIGWAYMRQEERRIDNLAEAQVAAVGSEIENRLEAFRTALTVLSVSPSVIAGDANDIRRRLEQIHMPGGVWFVLRDPRGQQLLNTKLPPGAPLPTFPSEGDNLIFQRGETYYANLLWGPVGETWITGIAVPVRSPPGEGEIKYSLSVVIPASYFQRIFEQVPKGWVIAINDRAGKIIARSLAHEQWVGKPMSRTGWEVTKDVPPGQGGLWQSVYSLEGTRVRGAYHRMESTGWLVGVSALPEVYQAPQRSILMIGAALVTVSLLLATLLAFLLGRRITRAIEVLQVKASAMRDMRVIDFPRTSLDEVNAVAAIMRDTAQVLRTRQEQQTTLIQELNHRVKNTLATIQSISRMTMKNSKNISAFDQAFSSRLMALSATHNLLTQTAWSGVGLHELLATELRPFQSHRVLFDGPSVNVSSKVAVALGMAVHEMGTNAAKYGALQGGDGTIRVHWSVAGDTLTLDWRERSERKIAPPDRQGFGSRLIQQTIVRELQGSINTVYHEDGLHAVLKIPLGVDDRRDT